MLTVRTNVFEGAALSFESASKGVLSWNTHANNGRIEFRLLGNGSPLTPWLPYAEWTGQERRSFSAQHNGAIVETDVIRSSARFDTIDVRANGVAFDLIAFAAPVSHEHSTVFSGEACLLDVPARSQYVNGEERGWCSPASLSMLHAFHGIDLDVATTARAVYDAAYNGTGNWSFNVALSGQLGFRAAVAYLRNLDHAQRLVAMRLPVAISYHWKDGELLGAPLEHSEGHLAVLCGFTAQGDCVMNDPAAPSVRTIYPRAAIERIWQRSGGVAYVIAPGDADLASIVNE